MTCMPPMSDSVEISSSVIPAAKYASDVSALRLAIGNTAIRVAAADGAPVCVTAARSSPSRVATTITISDMASMPKTTIGARAVRPDSTVVPAGGVDAVRSASRISAALANRSAGSLASARLTTRSTSVGTVALTLAIAGTGSLA